MSQAALHWYYIQVASSFPMIVLFVAGIDYLDRDDNNFRISMFHIAIAVVVAWIPFVNAVVAVIGGAGMVVAAAMRLWETIDRLDTKGRIRKAWKWMHITTVWPVDKLAK